MMRRRLLLFLVISASVSMASACTNPLSNLFGNPSSPSDTSTTDSCNGALTPNGSLICTFTVTTAGTVAVTLTSVSPATTSPLGLGIGPSSSGTCTIANSTSGAVAGATPQLSATENPGIYCVKVSDTGSLTTTSTVTVTVAHP